jgi:hypothetical protein
MKKLLLLSALLIFACSYGQQYSFSELIDMTSSLKDFESRMFKKANIKISGDKEEFYNARSPSSINIQRWESESDVYKSSPKLIPLKVKKVWSTFGEKYDNQTKKAVTFYKFYKGTIEEVEDITSLSIQYNKISDFESMVRYLSNNEDKFEYIKTIRETVNEKSPGYNIWKTIYSYVNNGVKYSVIHLLSSSGDSGNLLISK